MQIAFGQADDSYFAATLAKAKREKMNAKVQSRNWRENGCPPEGLKQKSPRLAGNCSVKPGPGRTLRGQAIEKIILPKLVFCRAVDRCFPA